MISFGWCAVGEAGLDHGPLVAQQRLERALLLAGDTGSAFVTGVAGSSAVAVDARGDVSEM